MVSRNKYSYVYLYDSHDLNDATKFTNEIFNKRIAEEEETVVSFYQDADRVIPCKPG